MRPQRCAVCDTPMDALHGRAVATRPRGRGGPGSGRGGNRRWSETGVLPAAITAHPPVSQKVFHRRGRPAAQAPDSGSRFFFFFRAIACVRKHCPTDGLSAADLTTAGRPTEGSTPPRRRSRGPAGPYPPPPWGGTTRRGIVPIYTRGRSGAGTSGPRGRSILPTHIARASGYIRQAIS